MPYVLLPAAAPPERPRAHRPRCPVCNKILGGHMRAAQRADRVVDHVEREHPESLAEVRTIVLDSLKAQSLLGRRPEDGYGTATD